MKLGSTRVLLRYGAAALAVGIALGVKLAIAREWAVDAPFLLFLGAVFFAAWFGGVGPGLLATGLATGAAVHFFVTPFGSPRGPVGVGLRLIQFLVEGGFVSVLSGLRRRSSADAYRRAEELRVTLASSGDGVVTAGPDGRVTFLNPAAEALTGWPAAAAVGRPPAAGLSLIDEHTRRPAACPCARALAAGASSGERVAVLVSRDGAERPVEGVCDPVHAPDGRLLGVVMVLRDTTERRRAEAARAETYRRTTAILESVSDAFFALDRGGRFTYVNARAAAFFGRRAADLVGRTLGDAFPALLGSAVEARFREAAATGEPARFETRVPGTGGWVEISAYPSDDGLAVYFRDVTARVRAEDERSRLVAQLEAEQDRLRTVLEQMPVGILVAATPGGRAATANPWAVELLGGVPADGGPVLFDPDGVPVPGAETPAGRALRGEAVGAEDFLYRRPDGRPGWLRVSAAPIRGRHGPVTGAVVVFDDVTRERDAALTLRRSHDVLLSRVATVAEEERRRLSREVHDETSQRLTGLILGLRSLRDRSAPGPAADALKGLQGQAEQIGEALHRIACDLRPAALDRLGLEAALRDAVGRWARQAGVRADFYGGLGGERLPPDVETHVYRMVNEGLTNAVRHAGARQVSVLLQRRADGLEAIIEDDGRGFDASAGGAGDQLGLRGMRERAALLGGTVEVESRPGGGTTVFVRVPVAAEERA
jgi:PAS domain S-box-containing protein